MSRFSVEITIFRGQIAQKKSCLLYNSIYVYIGFGSWDESGLNKDTNASLLKVRCVQKNDKKPNLLENITDKKFYVLVNRKILKLKLNFKIAFVEENSISG